MTTQTTQKILEHWNIVKQDRAYRSECLSNTGPGERPYTIEQENAWEMRELQLSKLLLEAIDELVPIIEQQATEQTDLESMSSFNKLKGLIGPCPDLEQRIKDLYIVNTISGWTQSQLQILGDMAENHKLPHWLVAEVKRIQSKIETVAQLENARRRSN